MNWLKLLGFKRKLEDFSTIEAFFELHSWAMEGKKDKNSVKISHFQ